MNRMTLAAAVAALSLLPAEIVDAQSSTGKKFTASTLDGMCKQGTDTIGQAFCSGFFLAMKTAIVEVPPMLAAGLGCIPTGTTVQQLQVVLSKYLDEHPENKNEDGRSIAIAAIVLAFPCSSTDDNPNLSSPSPPKGNATDICASRCLPPGGFKGPGMLTKLPPSTESCLRACGEEIGRSTR